MESNSIISKIIANMGYKNETDFFIKYILPLSGVILFGFFITLFIFTNLHPLFPYMILLIGVLFILLYPYIQFESKKNSIDENLHLFITYAGTIATIDISRHLLFREVADKKALGEIANVATKIEYFAKEWNVGFAKTCRMIGRIIPSKIFADFLDRLAIMFDFGESLETFLQDEQSAVMDDFSSNYKKSLENIKTIQDIFLSLTMALGFLISIGLILPLLGASSMDAVVRWALVIILFLDLFVLVFVHNFIPSDKLIQSTDIVDGGMKKIYRMIFICFPITFFLLLLLKLVTPFPFLIVIAISISPLFIVGLIAQQVENEVFVRDKAFPAYIRTLGSAIEIKGGAVMSALRSLQVHDFGPMNKLSNDLYRRLKTGNDKRMCWKYFSAESGSNLIYQFSQIFSEAIFLGGAPERIGEIVSQNFQKLISLRKLRLQLASGLRGALYGSLLGFSAAAYVSAQIAGLLGQMFSVPFDAIDSGMNPLDGIIGDSATSGLGIDMEMVKLYIGIMILVHAVVSALIIKIVDGGTPYAALFDMVTMIWMGAALSISLPWAMDLLLPGIEELTSPDTFDPTTAVLPIIFLFSWVSRKNAQRHYHQKPMSYPT